MSAALPKQKERYSRAWIVAAAATANFTYEILPDDEWGVDMTVRGGLHTIDFQLKATSKPDVQDEHLVFDLDVRTYNLLRDERRSGYGVLALVVVGDDTADWHIMNPTRTRLAHCAYYLPITGLPRTTNESRVRLRVPLSNQLTPEAMTSLMHAAAARWTP